MKAELNGLTDRVQEVATRAKAAIGNEPADVIGATLAYLVAAYLMGFPDREMRDATMDRWLALMDHILDAMKTPGGRMQ